ncbi:dihydrolipoyl dehydrogenase family protein [Alterisphingorhabdus coralli]|uniref:FAD-dependent oxidoreductase n=1 Tax=Alterisphingorhabdus coralli TaxID=3071408 RepID=A0AA97I1D8_9SPHN|nr:FAD-dependent oxidoreductase [Parasphingorhabdus sp. SCSIO 66989]WOE74630.1 FAD-dependent oxidoreductase [Parasphingorhabdus sp. SCSIO 66989]
MTYTHDIIVLGAGSAGLTAAGGCAMLGLNAALVERGEMGGDCLNTGCVPSKAIIAAAHRAHDMRTADKYGIKGTKPTVNFQSVHDHIHAAIATIAPEDSQERFEEMGVDVIRGNASFAGPKSITVALNDGGTCEISAPRIVIATGSRPFVPPIQGIENVPFMTNEDIWNLTELPEHLIVLGGGPIGMEMAQSFKRLGSDVTVATVGRPFPKDDDEAAEIVIERLRSEGIVINKNARAQSVRMEDKTIILTTDSGEEITGSHLLIATGREVNFDGLNLEKAGVKYGKAGIEVDARRRTNQKHIYAIGDCRPGPHFTHASGYEGSNIVLEVAFGLPTKVNYKALPWVTYVDPELAQVGLTEKAAREKYGDKITVWREDFSHNDRAITELETTGFVKIVKKGGKVIGATIVGAHAGDMLLPWSMAIAGKSNTFGMASLIVPYPNRAEHSKAAAFASDEAKVFNKWTKGWAAFLAKLRR